MLFITGSRTGFKKGGIAGVNRPPPFFGGRGGELIHFLYKVLGKRSVQLEPF